ncbi:MarR family transcriptional regulator [Phytohabitans sp. ZYX-F-186]|uniref:MarR family transcriptional regulator n=1 Tax=Phytohabitans maris TaxID=3071409 RepID=A0ABU0ZUA7_9ACTN|nr:MarR family transcriptional regulator [Phytohabitans sp. ZYX-F-186]MDQ7910067.1 MarR family transcriptional regulator [Phytohabitans sp. ZYX-F-186]
MELVTLHDVPLGRLLVLAGQRASNRWNKLLADRFGLTNSGMSVLIALHGRSELTHGELALRCFVKPATLTGIIDTLVKAGLVERRRDGTDRRAVRLALTLDGAVAAQSLISLISNPRPLTSVDADPAKAQVVREFLLEIIASMTDTEAAEVPILHGEESS